MMKVQHRCSGVGSNVLKRSDKPRHVTVAILVTVVNPAECVQYDQPGTVAKLVDPGKMPIIHYVQPLTHYWLKDKVPRDGFTCLLIQVPTDGMNPAHECGFWVFSCEVDDAASTCWGEPYKIPACNAACDGHCSFQSPKAFACSSGSYQSSYCTSEESRPNEV